MRTNRANTGKGFEDQIKACLTAYASKGLLRCCKVEPATRVVGSGKFRKVIFLHNDWLDFAGTWTENHGRMVVIEAKSTSSPRLALGTGGITDTQIQSMAAWHAAGAVVFCLWEYLGQCCMVTYPVIWSQLDMGYRSIKFENCIPIQQGIGFVLFDFMSVMRRLWTATGRSLQDYEPSIPAAYNPQSCATNHLQPSANIVTLSRHEGTY